VSRNALIHVMFFGSGVASLILQVVWFKQLQFVLGSSTFAVSVTVASFFLGLSAGSALGGRIADRVPRPLRAYGVLEFALGAIAVGVTLLLSKWSVWSAPIAPLLAADSSVRMPLMVAVSFAALLIPTMGMGATLPFLARYLIETRDTLAERIGVLYGINTLGAATGSLVVGFALMGTIGVLGSSMVSAAIYGGIGVLAMALSKTEEPAPVAVDEGQAPPERDILIGVFAVSGFLAIAYEIVWFRMLATVSHQTVYAFAGMLSVYLLGLVLGSLICARFLAPNKDRLLAYFALTQALIAVGATLSVALLGRGTTLLTAFDGIIHKIGLPVALSDFMGNTAGFLVLCLVVLLLPTTLIGVSFPLATELTIQRMGHLGRRVGLLYSLNTLGGVLGSLCGGFLLLPYLGSQWAMMLLISANFALFGAIWASQPTLRTDRVVLRQGAVAAAVIALSFVALGRGYLTQELTNFQGANVLELRESHEATYVVLEYDTEVSGRFVQLVVNSKSYASNKPPGRRYMAALAHYPTLLHRDPKDALVICIGTGTTVGSLTTYPDLSRIHAVDLTRNVFDFAPYFVPLNHSFHENDRVEQVVADGRHFLMSNPQEFDVLTFEPPPPHDAGVVSLYSEEFYALARARMRPGAVLAQWAPMDIGRGDLSKMIIKAMMAEFPHVSLWMPNRMEGVAIASMEPLKIDVAEVTRRMQIPAVKADLDSVGITSVDHFLGSFIAADAALERYIADVPSVTDDRPRLEYHNLYPTSRIEVSELDGLREPLDAYLVGKAPLGLRAGQRVVSDIWYAHQAFFDGDYGVARRHLDSALRIEPDNEYLHFLNRRLKAAEKG